MSEYICSKCGGPREPDSSSLSYCKECTRKYHRDRYRAKQAAVGKQVKIRTTTPTPNTESGEFEEVTQLERNQSRARIQFAARLEQSNKPQGTEQCDNCSKWNIVKGNCFPITRRWMRPYSLVEVNESQDERAVHLVVGLVCAPCKRSIDHLMAVTDVARDVKIYFSRILRLLPDPNAVEMPDFAAKFAKMTDLELADYGNNTLVDDALEAWRNEWNLRALSENDTIFTPRMAMALNPKYTQYDYVPLSAMIPEPKPNAMELYLINQPDHENWSDKDLIADAENQYNTRDDHPSWYQYWSEQMAKRNLAIPEEFFDEELYSPPLVQRIFDDEE